MVFSDTPQYMLYVPDIPIMIFYSAGGLCPMPVLKDFPFID